MGIGAEFATIVASGKPGGELPCWHCEGTGKEDFPTKGSECAWCFGTGTFRFSCVERGTEDPRPDCYTPYVFHVKNGRVIYVVPESPQ